MDDDLIIGDVLNDGEEQQRPVYEWDNHNTYAPGEIVYFNQKHWKATRQVTPPFFPSLMKGDEPGTNDAWEEISEHDVYGGNVLGALGDAIMGDLATAASVPTPAPALTDEGEDTGVPEDALFDPDDDDSFPDGMSPYTGWNEILGEEDREHQHHDEASHAAQQEAAHEQQKRDHEKQHRHHHRQHQYVIGSDVLGTDPGIDINEANRAIRSVKPMSKAQGQKFLDQGISALTVATMHDTGHPGATARRDDLTRQLRDMKQSLAASPTDPIPEKAAEILRNAVLAAVAEFNAVAQENADMDQIREQLYADIKENARQMATTILKLPGKALEVATGVPWWVWYVGIGGAAVLTVYGGYKFVTSPGGGRIIGSYLGMRR